jgi:antirestriction protein ArdC
MSNNVYKIITDKIINRLKKGNISWKKGWIGQKINYISRNSYSGINLLLLEKPGEYLTFNQAKKLGGHIKKGSKSEMIIYYKMLEKIVEEENEKGKTKKVKKKIPFLRYYKVFHIEDVEGVESKLEIITHDPIKSAETIVKDFKNKPKIETKNSSRAFYQPKTDKIVVPKMEQFKYLNKYYATLFHELIHSTGHNTRLNRFTNNDQFIFSSKSYSKEELVAEIGSAMLCNIAGIETDETLDNSAAYIKGWIKKLENNHRLIIRASSRAQKAVDLITAEEEKSQKTA